MVGGKLKADLTIKNFFLIFLPDITYKQNWLKKIFLENLLIFPTFESLFFWFADCTNESFMLMFRTDVFSTSEASVPSTHFFTFFTKFCFHKFHVKDREVYCKHFPK